MVYCRQFGLVVDCANSRRQGRAGSYVCAVVVAPLSTAFKERIPVSSTWPKKSRCGFGRDTLSHWFT